MLVTPEGGELVMLPALKTAPATIQRKGKFTLSATGVLEGEVEEFATATLPMRSAYACAR